MDKDLREKLDGGRFGDVAAVDSRRMAAVKGKGNKTTERRFRAFLVRAGVRGWRVNPKGVVGNPDLFFPDARVAVFLDGCFWHGCPDCGHVPRKNNAFWRAKIDRNRERDVKKALALTEAGYRVVRFWEHAIKARPAECVTRLKDVLDS